MEKQTLADRIDARLGKTGQRWKMEFVAMVFIPSHLMLMNQVGEYVGTTMFLFMAFGGTHIANLPGAAVTTTSGTLIDTSNLTFISISFGLALIVNIWLFFRISGALFNPAITLALVLSSSITPLRGGLLFIAQIVGGISAAALVDGLMPGPLGVATRLTGGITVAQGKSL
jgi:aquaporin rerated protein, other eukaryote